MCFRHLILPRMLAFRSVGQHRTPRRSGSRARGHRGTSHSRSILQQRTAKGRSRGGMRPLLLMSRLSMQGKGPQVPKPARGPLRKQTILFTMLLLCSQQDVQPSPFSGHTRERSAHDAWGFLPDVSSSSCSAAFMYSYLPAQVLLLQRICCWADWQLQHSLRFCVLFSRTDLSESISNPAREDLRAS